MSRENHIYEPDWSGRTDQLCSVNKPVIKKDALALVTGKPVYVDDLAPKDCLIVKVLRSPHANAIVKSVKKTAAERVPGIEAIYTWEDVPKQRFTMAGQTYPEPSPYDRLILDQHVRYVGDPVAIIAGKDEKCVDRARKLLKVEYEVLPAILDFHQSKDNELLVHPEESWKSLCPVGADNQRNLCASAEDHNGDVEAVLAECDEVVEHTYHVRAAQQAMMETFRTYCFMDTYGRLNVLSSTRSFTMRAAFCPMHSAFRNRRSVFPSENRRRIRSEADGGCRNFPGVCNLENRKTVENDLYERRVPDSIHTAHEMEVTIRSVR